jgi:anti-anti-sigma regulatory factor
VTKLDTHAAVRRDDTGAVITFVGELDLVSASAVSEWVDWAIDAGEARIVTGLDRVFDIDLRQPR